MLNIQENLIKLERELKLRNYSYQMIKAYKTCIKYFLEKIKKEINKIEEDKIN